MPDTELILDAQVFLEASKTFDPCKLGAVATGYLESAITLVRRLFCAYLTSGISDRLIADIRSAVAQYESDDDDWIDQAHQDGFLSDAMNMLRQVLSELRIEKPPTETPPLCCATPEMRLG